MMVTRWILLSAALGVSACASTMVVERRTAVSLNDPVAYAEIRTVRDPLYLTDAINDTDELWGVNRGDEPVCVGWNRYGYWQARLLPARTEMKIASIGQSYDGVQVGMETVRNQGCEPSIFR